jgi:hypothetical protein
MVLKLSAMMIWGRETVICVDNMASIIQPPFQSLRGLKRYEQEIERPTFKTGLMGMLKWN